jgi:hypothetical protein
MARPTTIKLGDMDSALILRNDGTVEFTIPDMDPNAEPTKGVLMITLLAVMFKTEDNDLKKLMKKKFKELLLDHRKGSV